MLPSPAGREASSGIGAPPYVRHRPECTLFINSSRNTIPHSRRTWRRRARTCRGMCSRRSRSTSSAGVSSMVSCACAAIPVMPSNWSLPAARSAVSAPAVARGAWPRARHCLPLHRHAPDQEGGVLTQDGSDRRGHPDPALRQCAHKIVGNDFEQPRAGPEGVEGRMPGITSRSTSTCCSSTGCI